VAQVFFNQGLTKIFNQLAVPSGTTPSGTAPTYYLGLFTGFSGTTVPTAGTTLATLNSSGYEIWGTGGTSASGYSRQAITWNTIATATAYTSGSPILATTLSAAVTAANTPWTVSVAATTGIAIGMTALIDPSGSNPETRVITGINGTQLVLSTSLAYNHSSGVTVDIGDTVNGEKSVGNQVTFTATGSWLQANGYFITDAVSSTTTGNIYYASNFADGSASNAGPTLGANDTLKVTPTWLLSN
jgi:hypothetical protein